MAQKKDTDMKKSGTVKEDSYRLEDSPNAANSQHLCAKNVVHEHWGEGQPIHGMHAEPDEYGDIAWYDVMFEHGLERYVPIEELAVDVAEMHGNHGGNKKKLKMKKEEVELDEKTIRQMTPKQLAKAQAKIDRMKDPKARKKAQAEFDKFLKTQEAKPAKPPKQSAYTAAGTAAAKIAKEKIGKEGGDVPAAVDKAETKRKVLDRSDIESGATAGRGTAAAAADRMAAIRLKKAASAEKAAAQQMADTEKAAPQKPPAASPKPSKKSGVDPFGGVGVPKKSKPADTIKKSGVDPFGGVGVPKTQVGTGDQHGGQKPVSAKKPEPQVGTGDQHGRPKDADPNRSDAKAARKAAAVPKKPTQGGDELDAAPAPKAPKDTAAAKKKEPKDDPTEGGKYAYYIKDPEKRKKSFWGSAMYRTDKEDPEEESQESYIYTSQDFKVQSMREALEFIRENND